MSKILVVFYSFSNTTRRLAEEIAKQTGGDVRELISEKHYAFNYNTATKEVRREIEIGYIALNYYPAMNQLLPMITFF